MSVLDLPLDTEPDELLLAVAINRVAVKPTRNPRSPRFDGKERLRRWGVQSRQSMAGWSSHEDSTYDEAFGPRVRRHGPTAEWDDHQAEALVVRLSAPAQAAANVAAHTVHLCKHCGQQFTPEERPYGPKQRYCNSDCHRLWKNHQTIERHRAKQAQPVAVAAFSMGAAR